LLYCAEELIHIYVATDDFQPDHAQIAVPPNHIPFEVALKVVWLVAVANRMNFENRNAGRAGGF
jgi:hypothetical protein